MSISKNGVLYANELEKAEAYRNNNALEYALSSGIALERIGNYYRHKEHDSMIFSTNGLFFWNSQGIRGNAIDFITKVEGKSYLEALLTLSNGVGAEYHSDKNIDKADKLKYEKKTFDKSILEEKVEDKIMVLPEKAENNNKAIDYLINQRKIDPILVNYLIKKDKIYQSIEYPNLKLLGYDRQGIARYSPRGIDNRTDSTRYEKITVLNTKEFTPYSNKYEVVALLNSEVEKMKKEGLFAVNNLVMIGYENKEPKYASRRSLNKTGKSYKADVTGSSKSCPFVINKNKDSTHIVLCESPIEVISYYEIANKMNLSNKDAHIISAGGVSSVALDSYLNTHKHIESISLAFNNDDDGKHKENAGLNGFNKIYEKYGSRYTVTKDTPYLNDWNDVLKELKSKGVIKDQNLIKQKDKVKDKEIAI